MKWIVCFHSDVDFRMTTHLKILSESTCGSMNVTPWESVPSEPSSEGGHDKVRKTGDGLGTLNTEEMNGPWLRPMAH